MKTMIIKNSVDPKLLPERIVWKTENAASISCLNHSPSNNHKKSQFKTNTEITACPAGKAGSDIRNWTVIKMIKWKLWFWTMIKMMKWKLWMLKKHASTFLFVYHKVCYERRKLKRVKSCKIIVHQIITRKSQFKTIIIVHQKIIPAWMTQSGRRKSQFKTTIRKSQPACRQGRFKQ